MNIGMHFGGIRSTLVEFERILVKIKSIPDFCQFVVIGKQHSWSLGDLIPSILVMQYFYYISIFHIGFRVR